MQEKATRVDDTQYTSNPVATAASNELGPRADHYAVTVRRNGDEIVTIETNCLSGRQISSADEKAIRWSARQLLGFIGDRNQPQPTEAQLSCGFALYGDPAICTCGTCAVENEFIDRPDGGLYEHGFGYED